MSRQLDLVQLSVAAAQQQQNFEQQTNSIHKQTASTFFLDVLSELPWEV